MQVSGRRTFESDLFDIDLRGGHIISVESRPNELVFPSDFLSDREETRIRFILVDWLIEITALWKLRPNTVHLMIQLVDRYYLMHQKVPKDIAQKVGCVCLWIAAKFHEVYKIPLAEDICYVSDDLITSRELITMEMQMLIDLEFNLWYPTLYDVWTENWDHKVEPFSEERIYVMNFLLEVIAFFPENQRRDKRELVQGAIMLSLLLTLGEKRIENPLCLFLFQQVKRIIHSCNLTGIQKKYSKIVDYVKNNKWSI